MDFETFKAGCRALSCKDWTWSDQDEILIFCKRLEIVQSTSDLDDFAIDDPALYVPPDCKRILKLEIHLLYSVIWDAPECYLNVFWEDSGQILEIDQFCSMINKPVPKLLSKRFHPVYNIPYYNLHSCHSQEWMFTGKSSNPFMRWMTTVNQMLDLVPMIDLDLILKAYPK